MVMARWGEKCCFCSGRVAESVFKYKAPPTGETRILLPQGTVYLREITRCSGCGHMYSQHDIDLSALYTAEYVDSTYGAAGLKKTFDRINALDPLKSDNIGRVQRVSKFRDSSGLPRDAKLLDVGAGLGVFPYQAKRAGWTVTALDPDQRAAQHIKNEVGIDVICDDFFKYQSPQRFNAVTINKVLEHVLDPVAMLKHAAHYLEGQRSSFVYIEVPDGEEAAKHGAGREEFFIEHHHIFSKRSVELMIEQAGFQAVDVFRLQEPSTKYTLFAFMRLKSL